MDNLEEKSEIEETRLRGVETIVRAAESCIGILPIALLTAMGIGLATYGAVKKDSGLICVGAVMTTVGAGFTGAYINAAIRTAEYNYKSDDETRKRG